MIGILFCLPSFALHYPLPTGGSDVFGKIQVASVQPNDTFTDIARQYDVGYFELVEANPEVNPDKLVPGTVLIIPTQHVLPQVPHDGIIINLASMRLYFFPKGKNYFYTYPIGIGKEDWGTPLGVLRIIEKIKNPVWVVPKSVMTYRKEQGDPLPEMVPSGPDNPLGYFALRLSKPTYLIHGTNDDDSVGRRSSAGCIHLYPKDIEQLFRMTSINTRVLIINQPYVAGWGDGKLLIEAHLPLQEDREALVDTKAVVTALVSSLLANDNMDQEVHWDKAAEILKEHTGIPTIIGFDQDVSLKSQRIE